MSNDEPIEVPARSDDQECVQEDLWAMKELLDRVDEEHRRFLAGAGRRISELELELNRTRDLAEERARQIVAKAEAEAAEIVQAAREDGDRQRRHITEDAQKRAVTLLEGAHKESEALLAAAAAEADRKQAEAELSAESLLHAARVEAHCMVKESQQEARRAGDPAVEAGLPHEQGRLHDEIQALVDQMGKAFQQLSGAITAMAPDQPGSAGRAPGVARSQTPSPEPSLPLMGSRGQQSQSSPGSSDTGADCTLRPFTSRPTPSFDEGFRRIKEDEEGSNGVRRGWRFRGN